MRQIAGGTTKSSAKIDHAGGFTDSSSLPQCIMRAQPAIMILVVWEQFFGRNIIEVSPRRVELDQDYFRRIWMPLIIIDCRVNFGTHEIPLASPCWQIS